MAPVSNIVKSIQDIMRKDAGTYGAPPLAEQKRIVAKVDELMALCDKWEAQLKEKADRNAALAKAALARFTDDPTTENLEYLFHGAFSVDTADPRKTILTLAVRGKLVGQDREEEDARELLARIKSRKLALQNEGLVPKDKKADELQPEDRLFQIPSSWQWTQLTDLTELITKGSSPKWQGIQYVSDGVLFITSENVGNNSLRKLDELKYVDKKFNEIEPRSILKTGDILINLVGASIGRTAIYTLPDGANINQAVALVRLVRNCAELEVAYLLYFLNSPYAIEAMLSSRVVMAQPNISLTNVRSFAIPLPPLAEQKRIVAKVDELMALVHKLEALQTEARSRGAQLLEAAVGAVLNAPAVQVY